MSTLSADTSGAAASKKWRSLCSPNNSCSFSASASEVFTGAMKDYGVATIVGTKTFGKGIVQTLMPLSDGSAIKLTTDHYYTPNGNDIHGKGIEPDLEVELDEEAAQEVVIPEEKDNQLQKAVEVVKGK